MFAYILVHPGLGDSLFMIGATRYCLNYYSRIFLMCGKKNLDTLSGVFDDRVTLIYGDEKEPLPEKSLIGKYDDPESDIFVCGYYKCMMKSKITNKPFLDATIMPSTYRIDYDTLTSENYKFIESFYNDMKLNLTYFIDNFYIRQSQKSIELFESIGNYYIIFVQYRTYKGEHINISQLLSKNLNKQNTIIVSNDQNFYNVDIDPIKYKLAEQYVYRNSNLIMLDYISTIIGCNEIYIIDSAFTGIVLPLLKLGHLKADPVRIIRRQEVNNYIL